MTQRQRAATACAIAACIAIGTVLMKAQTQNPVEFVRERSASEYGNVLAGEAIPLEPLAPGPGRVFRQPIFHSERIRLHVVVGAPPVDGQWEFRVLDGATIVWTTNAANESDRQSFWSDEFKGNQLAVEVHTTKASTGLRLTVDKVAMAAASRFVDQATTQPRDCKTPVETMTPPVGSGCLPIDSSIADRVRVWAASVVRLRLVADNKEYYCSGFLLTHDLVITNWHCIQSDAEMESTLVDFGFDDPMAKPVTLRVSRREVPAVKSALDFIVVRLRAAVDKPVLHLVDRALDAQELVIIQHPDGLPKQVSVEDCKVIQKEMPGSDPAQKTDFGHFCDTLGGSSGSPAQDAMTGDVIGLHHLGFRKNSSAPFNQAVRAGLILDAIAWERPDILHEIQLASGEATGRPR